MTEALLSPDAWGWLLVDVAWKSTLLLLAVVGIDRFFLRGRPLAADAVWFTTLLVLILLPLFSLLSPIAPDWQVALVSAEQLAGAEPAATGRPDREISAGVQPDRAAQHGSDAVAEDSARGTSLLRIPVNVLLATAMLVYRAVALLLALRLVAGYLLAKRFAREAEPLDREAWSSRLALHRQSLGIRRSVSLGISNRVLVPATLGWRRPCILLPPDLRLLTDSQTIDAILLHELTHIARCDFPAQICWNLCQCLYWWNPLVWQAARRAAETREVISDGYCVATLGAREAYVGLLLDTARRLVARRVPPYAVAMARTPQLRRRLELLHSLRVAAPLASQRYRFAMIAIGCGLLVAASVVRGVEPAAEAPGEKQATEPAAESAAGTESTIAPPELLYLTWQKGGWKSTGEPTPHELWDRDGNLLSQQQSADVLEQVKTFNVQWRQDGELNPLVLVFKVDDRLANPLTVATALTANGTRCPGGTACFATVKGLNVSTAAPQKTSLASWPKRISLELRYPIEDMHVIRELTEVPDGPVEIADGVTWYLDPDRALVEEKGRMVRAVNKTAAVLQRVRGPDNDAQPPVTYEARVFLKDGKELRVVYVTVTSLTGPMGGMSNVEVSEPFDSQADIARVQFLSQRFRFKVIKHVPLRLDLQPEDKVQ